jgi:hypothetical protein
MTVTRESLQGAYREWQAAKDVSERLRRAINLAEAEENNYWQAFMKQREAFINELCAEADRIGVAQALESGE